ncbi:MAG: fibronectin type III-like domain-contianing protein, partial [Sphaerochaetaceae bacterium]|nr:fibronectin type III-like domain-contianing protein [Sphaerochaetaceae bacterium]
TWASSYPEEGSFGDIDDSYYKEGIYVGYRYFDTMNLKPLFPFGYGLSYTDFKISNPQASLVGTSVLIKCTVTNTGRFRGKEVVQLYVSSPSVKLDQPYQSLCAFRKTDEILPGSSAEVELCFDMAEISSYSTELESYVLEEGLYVLRLGSGSRDTSVAAAVSLDSTVTVKKVKNVLGDCGFKDLVPEKAEPEKLPEGTKILNLSSEAFKTETVLYGKKEEIEEFAKSLTDEEICYLNIGRFKTGPLSIIGNASRKVAGAAGDFTDKLLKKGFPVTTLADGPAGLRLNRKYFIDKDGCAAPVGNDALAILSDFIPDAVMKMMALAQKKPKKDQEVFEQYCTMIPIGTAVAQSFNTDVARAFGDLVGEEMKEFKVDIWLAPAMNIHRDVRCGRNFEYYSEDPLLSGKIAAAVTKGVQSHPGKAVTIKHYAANNQENNRYGSNSHVSERAMREIYLKGFSIAVREASPKCVMTSYNLLNGTHTSEHKGLVESILRDEFGFSGVVMTDWIVGGMESRGKYGAPSSCKIAGAGGDVMMPGSEGDYKTLLSGLKCGLVSRSQLEENASRMFRLAKELNP